MRFIRSKTNTTNFLDIPRNREQDKFWKKQEEKPIEEQNEDDGW